MSESKDGEVQKVSIVSASGSLLFVLLLLCAYTSCITLESINLKLGRIQSAVESQTHRGEEK